MWLQVHRKHFTFTSTSSQSIYMFHLMYKNCELVEKKVQCYPILVKVYQLHLKKLAYEEEGIHMKLYIGSRASKEVQILCHPYKIVIRLYNNIINSLKCLIAKTSIMFNRELTKMTHNNNIIDTYFAMIMSKHGRVGVCISN